MLLDSLLEALATFSFYVSSCHDLDYFNFSSLIPSILGPLLYNLLCSFSARTLLAELGYRLPIVATARLKASGVTTSYKTCIWKRKDGLKHCHHSHELERFSIIAIQYNWNMTH